MPPLSTYLLTALSLSLSTTLAEFTQQCFFPDGSETSKDYEPCNKGVNIIDSMCCATGGESGGACASNGLCKSANGTLYRGGCTDNMWRSTACLSFCFEDIVGWDYSSTDALVRVCDDGSVCCGSEDVARLCCQGGQGTRLNIIGLTPISDTVTIKIQPVFSTTSTSTSTSSPSPETTTSTPPSEQTTPSTPPSERTHDSTPPTTSSPNPSSTSITPTGEQTKIPDTFTIAIAISVPAVTISLLIIAFLLWDRRRKQKRNSVAEKGVRLSTPDDKLYKPSAPIEIGSSNTRYEWPTAMQLHPYARAYVPSNYNHRPVHHVNVHEMS
ncbi:hypothetical protein TWF718_001321 [Orbilia javanica]|uniref:Uncharacterized protein n=1 Tax=Orbilia javanica TaxID=47235 RepID=A0AAN8N151_9PEZI